MIDTLKKEFCSGCEACYNICPVNAICMEQDREGFYYPEIRTEKCIACGKCEEVCPHLKVQNQKNEVLYAAACYAKDQDIRDKSTSGGIFSLIADFIIRSRNGIVYGVAFDEEFQTIYSKAEKIEDLSALRGSKYVQCRTGQIYREVKEQLESGKTVFFTGLPCHGEALISYLGKVYPELYVLDMVCFGIASPRLWQKYLTEFHDKKQISEVVFKDKTDGWKQWRVKITEDGRETLYERKENLYMNSYLQKINIRKSCFHCPFKGLQRISDFTIADCWGEGEKNQRLNDNRGLSALLIHTSKGKDLFEKIKNKTEYEEYDADILMKGNWAAYHAVEEPNRREQFFAELESNPFQETFTKYFGKIV